GGSLRRWTQLVKGVVANPLIQEYLVRRQGDRAIVGTLNLRRPADRIRIRIARYRAVHYRQDVIGTSGDIGLGRAHKLLRIGKITGRPALEIVARRSRP